MTRLTDGTRTVEITMQVWNGTQYSPDWSNDFFEIGSLPYDSDKNAYVVDDVDYCIDEASDWEHENKYNAVFVEEEVL